MGAQSCQTTVLPTLNLPNYFVFIPPFHPLGSCSFPKPRSSESNDFVIPAQIPEVGSNYTQRETQMIIRLSRIQPWAAPHPLPRNCISLCLSLSLVLC